MRRDIKGDSFPARRGVRRQASGGYEQNLKEAPKGAELCGRTGASGKRRLKFAGEVALRLD